MTNSDEIMTRYLLGTLSEEEQAQLEERYFSDTEMLNQLAQLESDLIDDYARGRLSLQMRTRLEQAYLSNPNRRARLKFSEALTTRVDQSVASTTASSTKEPSPRTGSLWMNVTGPLSGRGALAFSIAMALVLLSFASVWLFIQSQRLRQDLARARDAQSAQAQQQHEAEQQLASERTRTEELTAELERARAEAQSQPTPPASVASLILMVGGVRAVDTKLPPTLHIGRLTQEVRLLLRLRENAYQSYQLSLQTVGGKEIFNRQRLKPRATESGASFVLTLAASQVSAGDYMLTLRGYTPTGELEDVSQSLFRVEKK